jgi:hypothetical protein
LDVDRRDSALANLKRQTSKHRISDDSGKGFLKLTPLPRIPNKNKGGSS